MSGRGPPKLKMETRDVMCSTSMLFPQGPSQSSSSLTSVMAGSGDGQVRGLFGKMEETASWVSCSLTHRRLFKAATRLLEVSARGVLQCSPDEGC